MALVLKADYERGDGTITITELTGIYNSNPSSPYYNVTGWQNLSTASLASATAAVLSVTVPDPTTLMATSTPLVFDIYNDLPNINRQTKTVDVDGVDGMYYFTYAVTVTGLGVFKHSIYKLFTPQADCCIQRLSDAAVCDKSKQNVFSNAFDIYTTMKLSACCGKYSEAIVQLKKLQRICKTSGCGCC